MDAISRDHDVGFGGSAVGEQDPGLVAGLLETRGAMAGMHHAIGQCLCQQFNEIGAMHAEGRIPSGRIRDLHGGDRRAVMAEIMRAGADPGAEFLHRRLQADTI